MSGFINESELPFFRENLPDFDENFGKPIIREYEIDEAGKTIIDSELGIISVANMLEITTIKVLGVGCKHSVIKPLVALVAIEDITKETNFFVSCCLSSDGFRGGKVCNDGSEKFCRIHQNFPKLM